MPVVMPMPMPMPMSMQMQADPMMGQAISTTSPPAMLSLPPTDLHMNMRSDQALLGGVPASDATADAATAMSGSNLYMIQPANDSAIAPHGQDMSMSTGSLNVMDGSPSAAAHIPAAVAGQDQGFNGLSMVSRPM